MSDPGTQSKAAHYRCECGWAGTESEMDGDYFYYSADEDEAWCNTVCPECGKWQALEDYELLPGEIP